MHQRTVIAFDKCGGGDFDEIAKDETVLDSRTIVAIMNDTKLTTLATTKCPRKVSLIELLA
jgi:hypothetical protein